MVFCFKIWPIVTHLVRSEEALDLILSAGPWWTHWGCDWRRSEEIGCGTWDESRSVWWFQLFVFALPAHCADRKLLQHCLVFSELGCWWNMLVLMETVQTNCEISFEMDLGASPLSFSKEHGLGWLSLGSCAITAEQHWSDSGQAGWVSRQCCSSP